MSENIENFSKKFSKAYDTLMNSLIKEFSNKNKNILFLSRII